MNERETFKAGFISIIGCPNVGKSTLLNRMVGQKVAIVSDKPQTTRSNIQGVLSGDGFQIIFIDTPGLQKPRNKLGEYMARETTQASDRVDAIVLVLDGTRPLGPRDKDVLGRLASVKTPVIVAVNKSDAVDREQMVSLLASLQAFDFVSHIIPVSALKGTNVDLLINILKDYLEPGPQYFPDDMITDQPERVLAAEFIREKALQLLQEEVPHGIGVEIQQMKQRERDGLVEIFATIYCERPNHKAIIIGKHGSMLKKIGELARADIEFLLDARVYLNLWVKVQEGWRNSENFIRELGYK
ncbi:MAG: GTPase Era [Bacillota bacterium]